MSVVSLVISLLIACIGMVGIVSPESLFEILRHAQTPAGMYFAAGSRVLFGVSLVMSATRSRTPDVLRVLGWVFLVAGLLIPVLGFEFFRSALGYFMEMGHWAARIWGVIALVLGLSIAYSVSPRSSAS